jgi:hypothetical protein
MLKSRRVRELVLLVIGLTTPVGILVVNAAALIMAHLAELRLALAVSALISCLLLNSLTAYVFLGWAERNVRNLYAEYRRHLLVLAVLWVAVSSILAAYLTYLGMSDPRRLPDLFGVLGALSALAFPFAISYVIRRRAAGRPDASLPQPSGEPPAPSGRRIGG